MKKPTPAFAGTTVQEHLRVMLTWAWMKPLHLHNQLLRSIPVELIEVIPPSTDVFFQRETIFSETRFRAF
jgi:hypothetical protein